MSEVCAFSLNRAKHLMFNGVEKRGNHMCGGGTGLLWWLWFRRCRISERNAAMAGCGRRVSAAAASSAPVPGRWRWQRWLLVARHRKHRHLPIIPPQIPRNSHHHLHHRHPFSRHQALLRPSQNLLESSMNFLPGERRQF